MKTYIALLRGINVSGQKKIKMVDLKAVLEMQGFAQVQTYIQSGNIVLKTEEENYAAVATRIQKAIGDGFGFEVPVLVLGKDDMVHILNKNPFASEEEKSLYFVLLKQPAQQDRIMAFNQLKFENEDFYITDECVYLCCKAGYGRSKLNNNLVEQKLGVTASTRNLRTMQKLLEMAKS